MGDPASSRQSVFALLAARELGSARHCTSGRRSSAVGAPGDVAAGLRGWAETDSLRRCSASYCVLQPPPRSTIAAAYSPDGLLLASTQCVRRAAAGGGAATPRRVPKPAPDVAAPSRPARRAAAATTR
jgi:hypothetical protein